MHDFMQNLYKSTNVKKLHKHLFLTFKPSVFKELLKIDIMFISCKILLT